MWMGLIFLSFVCFLLLFFTRYRMMMMQLGDGFILEMVVAFHRAGDTEITRVRKLGIVITYFRILRS